MVWLWQLHLLSFSHLLIKLKALPRLHLVPLGGLGTGNPSSGRPCTRAHSFVTRPWAGLPEFPHLDQIGFHLRAFWLAVSSSWTMLLPVDSPRRLPLFLQIVPQMTPLKRSTISYSIWNPWPCHYSLYHDCALIFFITLISLQYYICIIYLFLYLIIIFCPHLNMS